MTTRSAFLDRFAFGLDSFQLSAMDSLDRGRSVVVAAPTGAGKTIVGEYAVHLAMATGRKIFYTAPIKALSNQKYAELVAWLGHEHVGLITGDTSVNSEAQVVVMTTEILRNMIYASSSTLGGLAYVVMDEVHYLADRMRGPVWEEIIIHMPDSIQLVALSATVSNVEEFGAWIEEIRGSTDVIVSERRPVPLWQHVFHGGDLIDVFVDEDGNPVPSHGPQAHQRYREVNPVLASLESRSAHTRGRRPRERHGRRGYRQRGERHRQEMRPRHSSRADIVTHLESVGLLPAIYFIFSRSGCDQAVGQLVRAGARLTSDSERREIREAMTQAFSDLRADDYEALGIERIMRAAMQGVAAHHAGQLPAVKVVIEQLFARGLIKVVFATETLALGVNMPARTVVIEKLTKFNGREHAAITPGEFTQLTGRAGRRGIDTEGHAVVVVTDAAIAADVAGLASRRSYRLVSAFRPTYNMSVNLLSRFTMSEARETLESSLAQFHADRAIVSQVRALKDLETTVESYAGALTCELGDILEYADMLESISQREKHLERSRAAARDEQARATVGKLRRGDVIAIPGGRRQGFAAVIAHEKTVSGPQVTVVTQEGQLRTLDMRDFPSAPMVLTTMRVQALDRVRSAKVRRDIASSLREKLRGETSAKDAVKRRASTSPSPAVHDRTLASLREKLREHPCHACPEREAHMRWIARYRKATRQRDRAVRAIEERTSLLSRQFDRVLKVLETLGYVGIDGDTATVLDKGALLSRVYSERDLLVCEAVDSGLLSFLSAAQLAAVASALAGEARRDEGRLSPPEDRAVRRVLAGLDHLLDDINRAERAHGVEATPAAHPAMCEAVYRWCEGKGFAASVGDAGTAPGDFVRHVRQVIDLLDHLAHLPGARHEDLKETARRARLQLLRGIVAEDV